MANVIANVEELRDFGRKLNRLAEQVRVNFNTANQEMQRIGETWRDGNHVQFKEQFSKDTKKINEIADRMIEYNRYIEQISRILGNYNETKMKE